MWVRRVDGVFLEVYLLDGRVLDGYAFVRRILGMFS